MRSSHLLALSALAVCAWADHAQGYKFQKLCNNEPSGIDTGALSELLYPCSWSADPVVQSGIENVIGHWGRYSKLPVRNSGFAPPINCATTNGNGVNDVSVVPWSHLDENTLAHTDYAHENVCFLPPGNTGDYSEADVCLGPGMDYRLKGESALYNRALGQTGGGRVVMTHEIGHQLGLGHHSSAFSAMNTFSAVAPSTRQGPGPMPDDIIGIAQIYGWKNVVDIAASGQRVSGVGANRTIIGNHEAAASACRGGNFSLTVTSMNMGSATANFNHRLDMVDSAEVPRLTWTVNNQTIPRGVASAQTFSFVVPANAPLGTWHLIHSVNMAAAESSLANNRVKYTGTLTVRTCP